MAPQKGSENITSLTKKLKILTERVDALEAKRVSTPLKGVSINKVEGYNQEQEPEQKGGLQMGYNDKIISMRNAIKILNPKLIDKETGRHEIHNVAAICGFKGVTEEMMDDAYKLFEKDRE
mgnify:CR=1 FL=1